MVRPKLEVADIFRRHGEAWRTANAGHVNLTQQRVMTAIEICRTAALGGHIERCQDCAHTRIAYNSCRNRHCPKCQWRTAAAWLAAREAELLPVPYFHFVFALPAVIGAMAYQNKAKVYRLLFKAAAEALTTIAADRKHLGAEIGVIAVLHTWGQNLHHHPHVHCVVPGGGVSPDGKRWIASKPGFFLPVRVLSRLFRRLFLEGLTAAFEAGELQFFTDLVRLNEAKTFAATLAPLAEPNGSSMRKRPSPVASSSWPISRATPIVSLSPTLVYSMSMKPTLASAGRTSGSVVVTRTKSCGSRSPSLCAASSCTCCQMASIVFVTTACWRTAIAPTSSRSAEACWPCALRPQIAITIATTTQVPPTTKRRRALAAAAAWQLLKSLKDHSIGRIPSASSTACNQDFLR